MMLTEADRAWLRWHVRLAQEVPPQPRTPRWPRLVMTRVAMPLMAVAWLLYPLSHVPALTVAFAATVVGWAAVLACLLGRR